MNTAAAMEDEHIVRTTTGVCFSHWRARRHDGGVLFVHGLLGHRYTLKPLYGPLIGTVPVASLDLPWHGASRRPLDPELDVAASALGEVLDALEWRRCRVVTHGWGSAVVIRATEAAPQRFGRQLFVTPPAEALDPSPLADLAERVGNGEVPDALLDLVRADQLGAQERPLTWEKRGELLRALRGRDPTAVAAFLRALSTTTRVVSPRLSYPSPVTGIIFRDRRASHGRALIERLQGDVVELEREGRAFCEVLDEIHRQMAALVERRPG